MKKLLCGRKGALVTVLLFFLAGSFIACSLTACSSIRGNNFIEIENKEEQYKKMEQELKDLKKIKVKRVSAKRWEELREKIYENYFRNKDDKEHIERTVDDDSGSMVYRAEDMYQLLQWGEYGIHYCGDFFREDYVYYQDTDEKVMEEEIEKLFKILGLEYNNKENGYAVGKVVIQGDNATEVHFKRYIDGKELSMAGNRSMDRVDEVQVTFGNNQIIDISLLVLSDVVEITDGEEVSVDSPQKAYKLLVNFINSWGYGIKKINTMQIAYMPIQEEDGVYTLGPVADFYTAPIGDEKVESVYQVDLTTKEVDTNSCCSYHTIE